MAFNTLDKQFALWIDTYHQVATPQTVSVGTFHGAGTVRSATVKLGAGAAASKQSGAATLRSATVNLGATVSAGKLAGTASLRSAAVGTGAVITAGKLPGSGTVRAVTVKTGAGATAEMLHGAARSGRFPLPRYKTPPYR